MNHWIKNGFVFLPLIFSSQLGNSDSFFQALIAALGFCFASSFVYILNDLFDQESDTLHPAKKHRPLASGKVSRFQATIIALILLAISFGLMLYVSVTVCYLLLAYIVVNIAYSLYLKKISIIDCICVATGFIIRILVGCEAISVPPSDWILTITFFVALFLAFSKRKAELLLLTDLSAAHRKSLNGYSVKLLDVYILICAIISLTAYLLYSFDYRVVSAFHTTNLKYSVLFVVYGFFRYFQLMETNSNEGDPTTLVLKDKALQLTIVLWLGYIIWVIYG